MTEQSQPFDSPPRTATRAPVNRPVKLQFDDSPEVTEGPCLNISIGGMQVRTEPVRPQGSLLRFELALDDEVSIRGLGEVAWARSGGPGREPAMGIKFRFLEQRDRQLILRLVSQYIKERLAQRHPPVGETGEPESAPEPARDELEAEPVALPAEPSSFEAPAQEPGLPSAGALAELFAASKEIAGPDTVVEPMAEDEYEDYEEYEKDHYRPRPAPRREFPLLPVIALLVVVGAALLYFFWGSLFGPSEPSPTTPPAMQEEPTGPPPAGAREDRELAGPGVEPSVAADRVAEEPPADLTAMTPEAPEPATPATPTPSEPPPPRPAAEPSPPPPTPSPEPAAGAFSRVVDVTWRQEGGELKVMITADGPIAAQRYRHLRLPGENPREVIRLLDVERRFDQSRIAVGAGGVQQIRVGYHIKPAGNELHLVLDMADASSRVTMIRNLGSQLEIIVGQ